MPIPSRAYARDAQQFRMNRAQMRKIGVAKRTRRPSTKNAGRDQSTGKVRPHEYDAKVAVRCAELAKRGADVDTCALILDLAPGQVNLHYGAVINRELTLIHLDVIESILRAAKGAVLPDTHVSVNLPRNSRVPVVTTVPLKKHYPPNVSAQQYWLRNLLPDKWRRDLGVDPLASPEDAASKIRAKLKQMDDAGG